ncbi:MAG: hypothetical protein AB7P22_04815 [Vicinamibacterales bacterium]
MSLLGGLGAMAVFGPDSGAEVIAGFAAPFLSGSGSATLTERMYRLQPERVLPLMMTGFVVKMAFFGAYVAVMLSVVGLQPVPFALSFTAAFIALHMIEALQLRRLYAGPAAWGARGTR